MALTYTPAGELGSPCPAFRLPHVDGQQTFAREDFKNQKALVVMFLSGHCPYVQAIEDRLLALAREMQPQGVGFVAISSNDPTDHPEDAPGELYKRWREKNYSFPYLFDATQDAARAFAAVCTPDLYVYDAHQKLCYRGRLDDTWRNPARVQRQELKDALNAVLHGQAPASPQNPSMGCSLKWKKG